MGCRDAKTNWGGNNVGGYCNPKVDALAREALAEPSEDKRDAYFAEAWRISLMDDVAYIPLHQQPLGWGVSKSVHVIQPPNNFYNFRWARMD
jgi:peptide/nickel transport system substrate-binding protein